MSILRTFVLLSTVSILGIACDISRKPVEKLDFDRLAKLVGYAGSIHDKASVFEVRVPRRDTLTTIAGVQSSGGLGQTAWATFTGDKIHTILIGEVPLKEDEVNGFLSEVINLGLEVTALHNTFMWDSPRIMSLHFAGDGTEEKLGAAVGELFKKLLAGKIPAARPNSVRLGAAKAAPGALALETIHRFLWKGEFIEGAYHISTGRGTERSGVDIGQSMGVGSWASFVGSSDAAVVNGDIAMLEYELNDVLKALIDSRIFVVSVHTHLTKETPRVMFVHYWGTGKLEALVKGVRAALDVQKNFRGSQ